MERLLAWSFSLLTILVLGYMIKQSVSGKRSILSIRNVFLLGLIIFQLTSAALTFFAEHYGELPLGDPAGSGVKYLAIITTFLILFVAVYESGWFTFGIQNRIKMKLPVPGSGAMLTLSMACMALAVFVRFVFGYIPLIGIMAEICALAMAAMAAGLAAWAWASNPRNLLTLGFLLLMAVAASSLALFESFGRHRLVGVMVACLWGAYHGGFKYVSPRRAALPLAIIGVCGLVLVAAFTSTRGHSSEHVAFSETLRRLSEADIGQGMFELLAGQDAASNSLWIIENRPTPFPYDPLASLVYFVAHPIPRAVWESKPIGLGSIMVDQSMVSGKGEGFSFGAGLVGHIVNDNPWIALPLYAVLLAAWLRIMDDLLKRFPTHPFIIMPLGIELGEILGLARGELGFFLYRAASGMISAWIGTLIVAKILHALGFRYQPADELPEEPVHDDSGYGQPE